MPWRTHKSCVIIGEILRIWIGRGMLYLAGSLDIEPLYQGRLVPIPVRSDPRRKNR